MTHHVWVDTCKEIQTVELPNYYRGIGSSGPYSYDEMLKIFGF